MRTFVVGDIHGQAGKLETLLRRLRAQARDQDTLVFLGDYIDRGPESRKAVDLVLAQRERWPGPVVTLKGNHEAQLLEVLVTWRDTAIPEWGWLEACGGAATITSYTGEPVQYWTAMETFEAALPEAHRAFFEGLLLWYEDQNGIYVHAGIPPGKRPEECSEEDLLWIRGHFIDSDHHWGKPVVFGHTPQYDASLGEPTDLSRVRWRPLKRPEKIGLDTGAGYGGPLTAVVLPERRFMDSNWLPF